MHFNSENHLHRYELQISNLFHEIKCVYVTVAVIIGLQWGCPGWWIILLLYYLYELN